MHMKVELKTGAIYVTIFLIILQINVSQRKNIFDFVKFSRLKSRKLIRMRVMKSNLDQGLNHGCMQ